MERPLLWGCLFYILGIILARLTTTCITFWLILDAVSFFVAVACFVSKNKAAKVAVSFFLLLSLVLTGAFWYSLSRYPEGLYQKHEGLRVSGTGVVLSYPNVSDYSMSCMLNIEAISAQNISFPNVHRVLLKGCPEVGQALFPGDRVYFQGELAFPAESRNPGEFNYRQYLANQEIFYMVNCQKGKIALTEKGQGLQTLAAGWRVKIIRQLTSLLPQREQGLLLGILFGETKAIEEEEWEAYKKAGVVHLFAVSGLHVGIVLGIIWFLLSFFQPKPLLRLLLGGCVLLIYGFMVGWSSSILRATFMTLFGLLALTVGRKNDVFNSLGAAAWIILLSAPGELFQVGFQLSFLITAGIVYLTPWLEKWGCGKILAPALAAQLAGLPLTAYYFNQISVIAPLVNVFVVALSGIAAVIAFVGAFFTLVLPLIATPLFLAAGSLMFFISEAVIWCAKLDWAGIIVAEPSPVWLVGSYLLMLVFPVCARYRYIIREIPGKLKIGVVGLLIVLLLFICWPGTREMEVVFLDVGQGDSILLRTPGGRTILVDGGGTPNSSYAVGKNVVRSVLYHYGIHKIDLLIMSHNHLDHSEGLLEILPYFKVGAFLMPPQEQDNNMEKELIAFCRQQKIPVGVLTAGQSFQLEEDVLMEVLHPAKEDTATGNNHSLVLKFSYRHSSWLLTGDVEQEAVQQLLEQSLNLQAAILKIPHHGSNSSYVPDFYQRVQPHAVVISVGENNFGQPAPTVIEYFRKEDIPVYVTQERGAVLTRSNGEKISITTHLPLK